MSELWSAHGGQLWRAMLAAGAGRRELADDVTAEAFARLLVYERNVRDPLAWLFRTAYRLLEEELRRERRSGRDGSERPNQPTPELDPEVVAALSALDPKLRLCVFLHYYADLPVAQVAHLVGVSVPTVKVRLHRARVQLRQAIAVPGGAHV
jgi:RNA polymerase sigma-70 factor (ECF subfamily)